MRARADLTAKRLREFIAKLSKRSLANLRIAGRAAAMRATSHIVSVLSLYRIYGKPERRSGDDRGGEDKEGRRRP